MNALTSRSPWRSIALAALVAVWSSAGTLVPSEIADHDLAPFVETTDKGGEAGPERGFGSDHDASLESANAVSVPIRYEGRAVYPRPTPETYRPLRHLLCVYRL